MAAAALLALTTTACGVPQRVYESGTIGTNDDFGEIQLRNVHLRPPDGHAFRPGDDGVVSLALFNRADHPDALVDVRTPVAADVEIFWDRDCDGSGEQVARLPLAANDGVTGVAGDELAYHLRLIDFSQEVLAGTTVPVTFQFDRAGETTLDAIVEASGDGDASLPPSCAPALITLTGVVQSGVEPRCLVLKADDGRQFLLLGGSPDVLRTGAEVVVEGTPALEKPTTCTKGIPLRVTDAKSSG
ncbi:copper chaperone PCu(A)C [Lentzea sp. BCCO 10_0798]|uniref:Copper chaperone PCu(A)C n=1 Tax=Lentzea kristufekii TaxID=3095430 RepID=A0ABU4U7S4_9PSEU|nr:copper chaperone PCu(A)C [Lentzea sp. BCCO 10_0798]MDX8056629.1 copper chaperone PCu(A)C [Lentzea sp. BCCO 10_0798]